MDEQRGRIIQRMKGMPEGRAGARFPIRCEGLNTIGYLRAFGKTLLDDADLIRTMAQARTRCGEFFLTRFEVSPENKRAWLEQAVLNDDSRMLFLVETSDGRVVGQDGFSLLDGEDGFESNGTMRWARGGPSDLFIYSCVERAGICFGLFSCRVGYAEIFNDNDAAIENIAAAGFTPDHESLLHVSERDGKTIYRKALPGGENTQRTLVTFSMTAEAFAGRWRNILDNPGWGDFAHAPPPR